MLKHEITYEDFNGETVTESFYFNISKAELVEWDAEHEEGMDEWLKRLTKTQDKKQLIAEFKRIILDAYGQKSPDGKRFIKNDELRVEFSQSAAYNALFMKLATEDEAAAKFIQGILPKDLAEEAAKAAAIEQKKLEEAQKAKKIEAPTTNP